MPLPKATVQRIAIIGQILEADGILYAKGNIVLQPKIFRLDEQNETLVPVQGVPAFDEWDPAAEFMEAVQDVNEKNASNLPGKFLSMGTDIWGAFAVSGNTFYVERKRKLLIWNPSSQENNGTG